MAPLRPGSDESKIMSDELELTTNSPDGDPSTMKRFGYIAAKPSEFLIVYRRGKFRRKVSGQGARCFKWPWDTVAIVPTTLKQVIFQANQVTADNVDVRLRGVVLYRIRDPLKIYKLINFSYRQRGEAKLARMIADMCRSTAKWLVANMGVEDCVRRRKEEIALALKSEVESVVSADCPEGWGVDIITIDIQDIFIQDAELFRSLQAGFKSEKKREAQLSQLQSRLEVEKRSLETERALDEEQHRREMEKAQLEAAQKRAQVELDRQSLESARALDEENHRRVMEQARMAAARQRAKIDLERENAASQAELESYQLEQAELMATVRVERELARDRARSEAARDRALIDAEASRVASEEYTRALEAELTAESSAGPASLERLYIREALPHVSEAVAGSLSNAKYNVFQTTGESGSSTSPFQMALMQVLDAYVDRSVRPSPPVPPKSAQS